LEEGEIHQLIELEGEEGRILVFPHALPGPHGPVIKCIFFGIYEILEIAIHTATGTISPRVTTISFSEGYRFSGRFDAPRRKILSLWSNGWFITWENGQ
jgi:hypothetical protein